MGRIVITALLVGALSPVYLAQRRSGPAPRPTEAELVVQSQLEAYNRRDIGAFLSTYAPDAKLYDHPHKLLASGPEQMRPVYSQLFRRAPKLKARVLKRIVQGDFVIDHELVTGLPDNQKITAVAIYEVKGGKIANVWFVR